MDLYRICFDATTMFGWFESEQDLKESLDEDLDSAFVLNRGDNNLYHYWDESSKDLVSISIVPKVKGIVYKNSN